MADQDFQERTEKATSRRREKAREEGRVAKSVELNSAAVIVLGFLTLFMLGPSLAGQIKQLMAHTMTNAPFMAASDPTFTKVLTDSMAKFFLILTPVFAVMVVIAVGINVAQVGFKIAPKALEPKFEKLDITKGLKRLVSIKSLVDGVKNTLKLIVIGLVAYKAISSDFPSFFNLPDMTVPEVAASMGRLSLLLALKIGVVIFIIAVLDYLFQRYDYEKSIRMSKKELKDEYKDTEGDPLIKSRTRQLQREMSRHRMMQEVPTADVVITNPTEIAVALRYDQEEMTAPVVVAKGERLIAQMIREIAIKHNIPIVEDKPLARALFKMCDIGQMVPANLYRAVAEVLAYVYRLKNKVVR
jgi:flagellar biosynthetic protein FlhB